MKERIFCPRQSIHVPSAFQAVLQSTRGFSLIELLVVMTIITVLATLLFPLIDQGLQQSRLVTYMGNLRQTAIASNCYADGNANVLSPSFLHNNWWHLRLARNDCFHHRLSGSQR